LNIIAACLQIGCQTDLTLYNKFKSFTTIVETLILGVFTVEIFVKIVAEGPTPWTYFLNNWNKFDFFIVLVSYISSYANLAAKSFVMMLRLLRILRILKLLRAFPKLQVIVSAILNSLSSVFYIGVIIFIFLYFYAIVGMTLFAKNDPWHYIYLHRAFLTLFQGITFDNWIPVVFTETYGCFAPVWLYRTTPFDTECDTTLSGSFLASFLYFFSFDVIGGFILLSLFIGVVNVYMEVTNKELERDKLVEDKVKVVAEGFELDTYTVNLYREVFQMIDMSKSGFLGADEIRFGLRVAENEISDEDFDDLISKIDENRDSKIDFSEFLAFAFDLKNQRDPIKLRLQHKRMLSHKSYSMIDTKSRTAEDFPNQTSSEMQSEEDIDPKQNNCCSLLWSKFYRSRSNKISPTGTPPRGSLVKGDSRRVSSTPVEMLPLVPGGASIAAGSRPVAD
jgi:voltage-gated sodium channel